MPLTPTSCPPDMTRHAGLPGPCCADHRERFVINAVECGNEFTHIRRDGKAVLQARADVSTLFCISLIMFARCVRPVAIARAITDLTGKVTCPSFWTIARQARS